MVNAGSSVLMVDEFGWHKQDLPSLTGSNIRL